MRTAWPECPLGEVVEDAKPGFASGENPADGVFQFRMNNLRSDGRFDFSKKRRVSRATKKLDSYLIAPGDVLFNTTNSPQLVGKSAFFNGHCEPAVFSNHFVRLRPDHSSLDGRFLVRWLQLQFQRRLFQSRCKQWVNQATFGRDALLALKLPVPPIEEQRRLAAVLDQADEMRAKRRISLALLDSLTESIFIDTFGDPLTNPNGWPDDTVLGDASEITSGITKGRRLTGQSTRIVPYLAVANVQDGHLRLDGVKAIAATAREIDRYRLKPGDLLLTEGGDPDKLGRGTVWAQELPECIHQNHIFRVRVSSEAFDATFVSRLLASDRGRRYFLRSAKQTTGIASINKSQLTAFPMLRPPLGLQQAFVRQLAERAALRRMHAGSLAQLDELFFALQNRAFTGNL